jgi:hypothetical protein
MKCAPDVVVTVEEAVHNCQRVDGRLLWGGVLARVLIRRGWMRQHTLEMVSGRAQRRG